MGCQLRDERLILQISKGSFQRLKQWDVFGFSSEGYDERMVKYVGVSDQKILELWKEPAIYSTTAGTESAQTWFSKRYRLSMSWSAFASFVSKMAVFKILHMRQGYTPESEDLIDFLQNLHLHFEGADSSLWIALNVIQSSLVNGGCYVPKRTCAEWNPWSRLIIFFNYYLYNTILYWMTPKMKHFFRRKHLKN